MNFQERFIIGQLNLVLRFKIDRVPMHQVHLVSSLRHNRLRVISDVDLGDALAIEFDIDSPAAIQAVHQII